MNLQSMTETKYAEQICKCCTS